MGCGARRHALEGEGVEHFSVRDASKAQWQFMSGIMSLLITIGQLTDRVAAPGQHGGRAQKGVRHAKTERDENKREQQHGALQGKLGTGVEG